MNTKQEVFEEQLRDKVIHRMVAKFMAEAAACNKVSCNNCGYWHDGECRYAEWLSTTPPDCANHTNLYEGMYPQEDIDACLSMGISMDEYLHSREDSHCEQCHYWVDEDCEYAEWLRTETPVCEQ